MNIFKMLNPFNWFRKKELLSYDNDCAIIVSTKSDMEGGIDNLLNKKIVRFGNGFNNNPTEIIDYTPEEVNALIKIEEIPIVEEILDQEFDFGEENSFGEIVTKK